MSWTKAQVDRLIYLVSERPFLFDPRNTLYKNKGKRMTGFREIAEEISQARPNSTAEDCRKKWYSLRTTYLAERRKVASSKKSGVGAESVYVPSLFYYQEISFIDEYTSPRGSTSTLDAETEEIPAYEEEDIPVFEEGELEDVEAGPLLNLVFVEDEARPASAPPMSQRSSDPATPGPSAPKRRKVSSPDEASTLMKNATQAIGSLTSRLATADDLEGNFAKAIASKLRLIQDKEKKDKIMFELWKVFHDNKE